MVKMLKEGESGRMSTYMITWRYKGNHGNSYHRKFFKAVSAQEAVDFAREHPTPEGAEIIEVAKVVNNWK
jgi:hypothetical protein